MSKQPQKVVEAFTAAGAQAGSIFLREFTVSTLLIMQKIKCPLLDNNPAKRKMSDQDVLRLIFILAHPASESLVLLLNSNNAFDEAVIAFGDNIPLKDIPVLGAKMKQLFERAMSTAPGSGPAEKKSGETRIPSETSPSAGMDSAGH